MKRIKLPHLSRFARASILIAVFFGLDKILGFVRSVIINRMFGLSYDLDVFNAANNIPDLLSALISGGALGVALIPVLSETIQRDGRPASWDLFSRILNLAFLTTAALAVLVGIFAPLLVRTIIVPGFPAEQQALTVELMRLDLVAIIIFSISGLAMAGLQANQHFLLPALAPGLYNIGQIAGAVFLSDRLGLGIHGLVYGVIFGALLHLAIQVPGLIRHGFRWTPKIELRHPKVIKVLRLLAPRVATMFFIQMFFIVRDNLASGLGEGAVTALNLGWFIMQVPETLLGTAIAIALLPTISELFANDNLHEFKQSINKAANAILAFTIPSAVLLAIALPPLVQTAFDYSIQETAAVVLATRVYLLGLTGHALLEIAARSFYAQQDAKTPFFAAALTSIAYIILATTLSRQVGFWGIALANIIVFTLEAVLLLAVLHIRFGRFFNPTPTLLRTMLGVSLGSLATILIIQFGIGATSEYGLREAMVALGAMVAGGAITLPFILPEISAALRLGELSPTQVKVS